LAQSPNFSTYPFELTHPNYKSHKGTFYEGKHQIGWVDCDAWTYISGVTINPTIHLHSGTNEVTVQFPTLMRNVSILNEGTVTVRASIHPVNDIFYTTGTGTGSVDHIVQTGSKGVVSGSHYFPIIPSGSFTFLAPMAQVSVHTATVATGSIRIVAGGTFLSKDAAPFLTGSGVTE
jgi:hypothetical protein